MHMILEDFEIQDTPVGIFFNNFGIAAVTHVAEDKTFTVKNTNIVGVTTEGNVLKFRM